MKSPQRAAGSLQGREQRDTERYSTEGASSLGRGRLLRSRKRTAKSIKARVTCTIWWISIRSPPLTDAAMQHARIHRVRLIDGRQHRPAWARNLDS